MPEKSDKHKKMKKQPTETHEDDQDVEDADSEEMDEPSVPTRRSSTRLQNSTKKPRFKDASSSSEEDPFANEDSDSDNSFSKNTPKRRKRMPTQRNSKTSPGNASKSSKSSQSDKSSSASSDPDDPGAANDPGTGKPSKSGSFVVLKADVEKEAKPDIWKIDGKSLLQKYVPFVEGTETLYKNTSVYSGWTLNSRDQYHTADVNVVRHNGKETVVRYNRESVPVESD